MTLDHWPQTTRLTLESAIREGANYLDQHELTYGHGTDNSLDEAAWLVLEAMGLSPLDAPDYTRELSLSDKTRARDYLQQRAMNKTPAAYITGRTWFAGLEFYADARALVPRSPLAEPIAQGFCDVLDPTAVTRVLDLCTGGGCIAIASAYAFADADVDAADISADALALAHKNRELHGLEARVQLIQSDLFDALDSDTPYDMILSNPPYVDAEDMAALSPEFAAEPELGLTAGDDGLSIVRRILAEAADYLSPAGVLVCEVGNSAPALARAFPQLPFQWLDFAHGGEGIFLLSRDDLQRSY
ncbi:MAG TPA: 50S ribosomal protein L3 N(5)-glutamine methyltransferase [Gammaproteobacteria bacterium]|nr:50S ribosomal protein L3 N(5)-glutamine methyltransferase [Gammaproteobacteria bacterium]